VIIETGDQDLDLGAFGHRPRQLERLAVRDDVVVSAVDQGHRAADRFQVRPRIQVLAAGAPNQGGAAAIEGAGLDPATDEEQLANLGG
jgi:hypothetical protein